MPFRRHLRVFEPGERRHTDVPARGGNRDVNCRSSLCTGSATGSAADSKTACWGFESLPVCHFLERSLPGGTAYALSSELSVLVTSRFESGGRDHLTNAGVAEKVNATLKR